MIKDVTIYNYDGSASWSMYASPTDIVADSFGVKWGLEDIDGWDNTPDVNAPIMDLGASDGAAFGNFSYKPRMLELRGGLIATTRQGMVDACRRLAGAFDVYQSDYTQGGDRQAFVNEFSPATSGYGFYVGWRRIGAIEFKPAMNGLACRFSVPLIMLDPGKHTYQLNSVSAVGTSPACAMTVGGNMPAWPELVRIVGPITSPVISSSRHSRVFRMFGSIGSGASVDINMHTHLMSGVLGRGNVASNSLFMPVLPGANTWTLTGSGTSGSTGLRVDWRDSFQ